ncbi:hypothetical protein IT400_00885 [Candidatus Nomurabacteria bacterium]|nr:hypothetical protein [Candidatus Nomurabacteria bacterium]
MKNILIENWKITLCLLTLIILFILPTVWTKIVKIFRRKPKELEIQFLKIEDLPPGTVFEVVGIHPKTHTADLVCKNLPHNKMVEFNGSVISVYFMERTFLKLELNNYFKVKGIEIVWVSSQTDNFF